MLPSCCKQEVGLDHTEEDDTLILVRAEVEGARSASPLVFGKYLVCLLLALCLPQDVCRGLGSG